MINGKHLIFNNYFVIPVDHHNVPGVEHGFHDQAMNITSQALSDHVKAALKKIGDNLARN